MTKKSQPCTLKTSSIQSLIFDSITDDIGIDDFALALRTDCKCVSHQVVYKSGVALGIAVCS